MLTQFEYTAVYWQTINGKTRIFLAGTFIIILSQREQAERFAEQGPALYFCWPAFSSQSKRTSGWGLLGKVQACNFVDQLFLLCSCCSELSLPLCEATKHQAENPMYLPINSSSTWLATIHTSSNCDNNVRENLDLKVPDSKTDSHQNFAWLERINDDGKHKFLLNESSLCLVPWYSLNTLLQWVSSSNDDL